MQFRQRILGTAIGRAAMLAREKAHLAAAALRHPEAVGAMLNDNLATRLVTNLPAGTFVDVGCHLGSVVAEVQHRTGARVIAVEAIPGKAADLRRRFPWLTVHACAAGESSGEVPFFIQPAATGYSSLVCNPGSRPITVPLRRLDDLVQHADTVKIDVEGAELGVLRGAERLIAACRPVVMFESAPPEPMYTKAAMWDWCEARGYGIFVPDRVAHDGPALARDGFIEAHCYPRRATNFFAIPSERREAVRNAARKVLGVKPRSFYPADIMPEQLQKLKTY